MDDYTEQGHPSFVGRPNDADGSPPSAGEALNSPESSCAEKPRVRPLLWADTQGTHGGSVKPACSYHVVPNGAWSARYACPLCGGPREEVIGRIE